MDLLTSMVSANPRERPSAEECLANPWLLPLAGAQVPLHPPDAPDADDAAAAMARMDVNDQRMVHWGELWPDALRQAVQEFQGMNYRITDVNGRQLTETLPGQLDVVPKEGEFPLVIVLS